VVIDRAFVDQMIEHAKSQYPNEACGLLASKDGKVVRFYPITNSDASPVHYNMEPQEQLKALLEMDDEEWDLGAIYHSHTHTRADPSETDVSLAYYPESLYLIVSIADQENPEIRAFHINEGKVQEEPLELI
jgi:[CysO sulfur-carrier protein]-S-L-cysteine hydrolase